MKRTTCAKVYLTSPELFDVPQMPPKMADSNGCYGHTPKFTSGTRPLLTSHLRISRTVATRSRALSVANDSLKTPSAVNEAGLA